MPTINVYLPEELFELVKPNKSKIIQEALKQYHQNLKLDNIPTDEALTGQSNLLTA